MENKFNLISIWGHGDAVTHTVAIMLFIMSIASWTVIAIGILRQRKFKKNRARSKYFWMKDTFDESVENICNNSSPWKQIAQEGKYASQGFCSTASDTKNPNAHADWVIRSMSNVLDKISYYQSYGLVLLSSIGATAPFIGLFGTVWGIYHTLIALSGGGQMSIDQVAGPIGEALVMTAFGLVVAIPAVLGNNAIANCNRRNLQELAMFAQDLQTYLVTGQRPLSTK